MGGPFLPLQLLGAPGVLSLWPHLSNLCLHLPTAFSVSILPLPPLRKIQVIEFKVLPDNPGPSSHLKILNHIFKVLFCHVSFRFQVSGSQGPGIRTCIPFRVPLYSPPPQPRDLWPCGEGRVLPWDGRVSLCEGRCRLWGTRGLGARVA